MLSQQPRQQVRYRLVHDAPYTEHLGHDPIVLRFTADDAVAMAAD
jgi:hypothetical protein